MGFFLTSPRLITGIVNPKSASGATAHRFKDLCGLCEKYLGKDSGRLSWKFTLKRGHAEHLAREALEQGSEVILSAGGDGTHSEVVKGFFTSEGKPVNPGARLCCVSRGTAGDLCRSLGLCGGAEAAIRSLAENSFRRLDVAALEYAGRDGGRVRTHFINVASAGIGAEVAHLVNIGPKWMGGKAVFALATARAFLGYRNRRLSISIDDGPFEEHVACSLAMANGRFFGGAMQIAPQALLDDGLLDVVCVGDFGFFGFLSKIRYVYAGTHLSIPGFWCRKARTITVRSALPTGIEVDGEDVGALPVTITVIPGAIPVYVGEKAAVS